VDGAADRRFFTMRSAPLPGTFFLFTLNMTFAFLRDIGLVHSVTRGLGTRDDPGYTSLEGRIRRTADASRRPNRGLMVIVTC